VIYLPKYEVRVKTKIGEIVINFDTLEELKSNVDALDINVVTNYLSKFESLIPTEPRKPKPGFEEIYRFTTSDLVEFINIPDTLTKSEIVALVMFAYHPEEVTSQQVVSSSGIREAVGDYLTHRDYKKYFIRRDGTFTLSNEGLKWVTSKIVPKLKETRNI